MKTVKTSPFYWIFIGFCATLIGCAFSGAPTSSEDKQITLELFAIPNRVTTGLDSLASAEIWATLKKGGNPVGDSTVVVFATTVGTITQTSITKDGLALAILDVSFPANEGPPEGVVIGQARTIRDTLLIDFVTFGD